MTGEASIDILVAGGGTAGWMVAAALARFAPPGSRIQLVESEEIGTVGVGEATIPQIHLFNGALGLDEAEFLRETRGSFKLGISFDGWLRDGHSYMHAFGDVGRGAGLVPFQHYWLRAQRLGRAKPLVRYSLNELAARTMRMQRGRAHPKGREMPYAYHFDAGLYAAYLRRFAEARGVVRHEGMIAGVERDGASGDIVALELAGGRRLEAGFFIDCTGFRGLLIEQALGSRHILLAHLDAAPLAEPRPLRFTTGKRRRQWIGNCLAVGLAAGFMEPLESTSIHLVQSAISRFLAVLPKGRPDPAVIDFFNQQADFEWSRIRDFLVLHYWANQRHGQPFWDEVRAMALPDTLGAKLEQWRAAGFIHREHEELFTPVGWFQVLAGQGVEAAGYNPMADAMSEDDLVRMLDETEATLIEEARAMPRHLDFLRDLIGAPSQQKVPA